MREIRWFKGEGETTMDVHWSAFDQAAAWINNHRYSEHLTYREMELWAYGIVVATVGWP